METDQDIRQLEDTKREREAVSYKIIASYPPCLPGEHPAEHWHRCQADLQSWLAEAGCPEYVIVDHLGAWEHHAERGVTIERIYPVQHLYAEKCPRGFRSVAELIKTEWKQDSVLIVRTELEMQVI